ncbi:MAG TPA: CoA-binding protein [Baekduia sp.]|nr:CoA-binding protein [Baekduia sp.]
MSIAHAPAQGHHTTLREAAEEFLAQHRIAVAGVSRDPKQPANLIFRRLRDTGHEVFAVNPQADEVEGVHAFHAVAEIPGGVDGVVVVTPAAASAAVVEDCAAAGVPRVWLHRGIGPGSRSDEAIEACHRHGIAVIPGGCPNMFGATSDAGHRGMRRMLQLTHKVPRELDDEDWCCQAQH